MKPGAVLAVPLLLLAACGGEPPIPDEEILFLVETEAVKVEMGRAFPLTVTRVWSRDLEPELWSDTLLAPISLHLIDRRRREEGDRIQEVRRYRAYLFSRQDLVLKGLSFKAFPKGGGAAREAVAADIRLTVVPALDPGKPGPVEYPGPPLVPPGGKAWYLVVGIAVVAFILLLLFRRRPGGAQVTAGKEPAPPPPHVAASARLGILRGASVRTDADALGFHVEAAALLRDYLAERFSICRPQMTSDEVVEAHQEARVLPPTQGETLGRCLERCDLVKFARLCTTADDRDRLLAEAEGFIAATRSDRDEPGGGGA